MYKLEYFRLELNNKTKHYFLYFSLDNEKLYIKF